MAVPKWIDAVLDGGPDYIVNNVTQMNICHTEPTVYADIAAATRAVYTGIIPGDFTKAAGDTNPGRKVTLAAKTGAISTAAGNGNFIAFSNGTTLFGVISGDGDAIANGQQVDTSAVDVYEVEAPVAEA
jgi:hypothetical protein